MTDQQYYGGQQPGYPPPGAGYPPPAPGFMPGPGYPSGGSGYPHGGGYNQAGGGYPPSGFEPTLPNQNFPTNNAQFDTESQEEVKGFDFTEESIRKAFIRKVYSILMVSNNFFTAN